MSSQASLSLEGARIRSGPGRRSWIALVAVYLLWGSTYTAIQITVHDFPPLLMAGSRNLLGGALLIGFLSRPGASGTGGLRHRELLTASVVGLLLLLGGNGLISVAELSVPSGLTSLVIATVPLWMGLMSIFWGGGARGPGRLGWVGVLVGLGGVAVLASPSTVGHPPLEWTLGLLAAAILWSAGSIFGRRAALPANVLFAAAVEMLAGGLGLMVAAAVAGEFGQVQWHLIGARAIIAYVWLVLGGSVLGFTCYAYALKTMPAAAVATYAYANPVVALVLGFFILGQGLSRGSAVAGILILLGVVLMVSGPALAGRQANRRPAASDP